MHSFRVLLVDCTVMCAATACYSVLSELLASLHAQLYTLHLLLHGLPMHTLTPASHVVSYCSVHSLPLTHCIIPRPQFIHCFYLPGCSGPSGFSKWLSDNKKTLQEAHVGASHEEIVKLGIKQWRAMPKEEKQHWQ